MRRMPSSFGSAVHDVPLIAEVTMVVWQVLQGHGSFPPVLIGSKITPAGLLRMTVIPAMQVV